METETEQLTQEQYNKLKFGQESHKGSFVFCPICRIKFNQDRDKQQGLNVRGISI